MKFTGRERELALLNEIYNRPGGQFLVLYGRRRIGKTSLLAHWLKPLKGRSLFWSATQTSTRNQLRHFSQALFRFLYPDSQVDSSFQYESWESAFSELARLRDDNRVVIILDEFTYVMQADPEISSVLQHAWDHSLKGRENLMLVLSGSLAGMIQRHVLNYQAPLYGRATGRLRLLPLSFGALKTLFPKYRTEERVAVYGIAGGIPAYLELFDDWVSIDNNLGRKIISPANVMMQDAVFLLREQLDEPRNYMAVIEAIAAGHHQLSDLADKAGLSRTHITKYLSVLQELGYVEREIPATVRRPERSRMGRYVLTDPYMRFYFRFIHPNLGFIERGMQGQALSAIREQLANFIGSHTFEELCRDWVVVQSENGALPFEPEKIGRFWSRRAEVDVVAISHRRKAILLGECKWRTEKVGIRVIERLVEKTPMVMPKDGWQVHYVFFSKQGFTAEAESRAAGIGAQLVDLRRLEDDLAQPLNEA